MMKFVAVLALILVAVSAKEHFKQPKMPCAYKITAKVYESDKVEGDYVVEFNGRYMKLVAKDSEEYAMLLRPDIGKDGKMTGFGVEDGKCYVDELTMEDFEYVLDIYGNLFWQYVGDNDWDHKEEKKYKGKKCVHYYNDGGDEGIYVYDDYIYVAQYDKGDYFELEYEWKAPMKDFVLSKKDNPKCYDEEKKVAEEPSEDYIMCAASTMKVAFAAVFVALLAALF